MLNNFTKQAQKIILDTEAIAKEMNYSEVYTEHILLSFLKEKRLSFSKKLNEAYHLTYAKVNDLILNTYSQDICFDETLRYSNEFVRFLESVEEYSKEHGKTKITLNCLSNVVEDLLFDKYGMLWIEVMNENRKNVDEIVNGYQYQSARLEDKLLSCQSFASLIRVSDEKVILGRDKEVDDILVALSCRDKSNVVLLGHAGVGKTAIVEELARVLQTISKGNLKGYHVVNFDTNSAIAGTKYRGEFEQKIQQFLEVIKDEKVIIFIDEAHSLTSLGSGEGSTSLSEILKPILTQRGYKFIIATTDEEYDKFLSQNNAFVRRFRKVPIYEPDLNDLEYMISKKVLDYAQYHDIDITKENIKEVIRFAKEIPERFFPDKALDVIDFTMSKCSMLDKKKFDMSIAVEYIDSLIIRKENELCYLAS